MTMTQREDLTKGVETSGVDDAVVNMEVMAPGGGW